MGIRTPEGFHPTRLPSASTGVGSVRWGALPQVSAVRGWFARPLDRAGSGGTATKTATAHSLGGFRWSPGAWVTEAARASRASTLHGWTATGRRRRSRSTLPTGVIACRPSTTSPRGRREGTGPTSPTRGLPAGRRSLRTSPGWRLFRVRWSPSPAGATRRGLLPPRSTPRRRTCRRLPRPG